MSCGGGDDNGNGNGNGGGTTVSVTGVTLNKNSISMTVGDTETLTATVAPDNATNKNVTWSSSNEAIATVSNGNVTAVATGTVTITVTTADGGRTDTCTITVTPPYAKYFGTWADSQITVVITGNEIKEDSTSGSKIYFTITNWTAVENTDTSTKAYYPNGYKLEGFVNTIQDYWIPWTTVGQSDQPYFVYMHIDGTKIKLGSSTRVFSNIFNKQQ